MVAQHARNGKRSSAAQATFSVPMLATILYENVTLAVVKSKITERGGSSTQWKAFGSSVVFPDDV